MDDKRKMLLKILKVKSDTLKIYNKIPEPFNKGLKPNMDITKLIEFFKRVK
jgi:hypothetical protein